jgi:3-methyladenine DNA glycosylase/8-oxoguanine DNA glycosylase
VAGPGRGTLAVMPAPPPPAADAVELRTDRVAMADPVDRVPALDRGPGAVVDRLRPGVVRRAEPGPHGPLLYEAAQSGATVVLRVRGPAATPPAARDAALASARRWIGADDPDVDLTEITADHGPLHHAARRLGPIRLSAVPRVQEALGRAVLGALVQRVEAARAVTRVAALLGEAADPLATWPTAATVGRTPAHVLRRCGVSRRAAAALHAGALDATALERVRDDPAVLDRRLRALPGVGAWTSGEARRHLGDPDAVPPGDDGLPRIVCHALAGLEDAACTDAAMFALLAPYEGQRGRVVRLVMLATGVGLLPRHPRRAPRPATAAHRRW